MMHRLFGIVLVVAGGCSTLPNLDQRCGNGVIDDDEDCDNPGPGCIRCALACNDTGGCDLPGYRCAGDNLCHAPSGVFEQAEATSFPFPVGNGVAADIDGDKIGDVIGFSDITIDVHFGDRATKLDAEASTLVPFANASAAIRPLGDGNVDILLPTADGIAAFAAQSKLVLPYPFANQTNTRGRCPAIENSSEALAFFTINKPLLGVVRRASDGKTHLTMLDLVSGNCADSIACNIMFDPLGDKLFVDHYETTAATTFDSAVVTLGVAHPLPQPSQLCAMRVKAVTVATVTTYTVAQLNGGAPISTGPGPMALARSTVGATCPSLFASKMPTGIGYYPGSLAFGECTLDLASVATVTTSSMLAFPAGHIPLQPAIGAKGPDALVIASANGTGGTSDIYAINGNSLGPLLMHSTRPLYPIESGDLDGNGTVEGVASAAGQFVDIDVLYRTPAPLDGFITYRISTPSTPQHVLVGDYDGNGLADIAYTERVGSRDRLMVAYGTPDRPLPAIEITTFANIAAIARADIPDSIEPTGKALDDLIVLDKIDPNSDPLLTVLHGNPQRSMIAYYDPRDFSTQGNDPTEFISVIPGNFDPSSPANDLLALELHVVKTSTPVGVWLIKGKGGEALEDTPAAPLTSDIGGISCGTGSLLCAASAKYLAWPITDGNGAREVVIAIDNERKQVAPFPPTHHFVTLDPLSRPVPGHVSIKPAQLTLPDGAFSHSMFGADIDGDGRKELIVSFGPLRPGGVEPVSIDMCQVADDGVVTSCEDLQAKVPDLVQWRCSDVAAGNVSARGRHDPPATSSSSDLIALCRHLVNRTDALFRITHDTTGFHASPVLSHIPATVIFGLGDLNGDYVDDLVRVTFDSANGLPTVHIYPQCEARNAACRNRNAGTP